MKYKMNDIYNIDNMELMKEFPDNFFDLAIVDPPYGINVNNNMGRRKGDKPSTYAKCDWDKKAPEQEYFDELIRVSKNQIIWGANHFISKIPYDSSCWIVWDKLFSADVSFASVELAWTSFNSVTKRFTMSSNQQNRIHPTQKPVELYNWLLQNYAKKGNKILDTHLGSASSVIAIEQSPLELEYVACELDKDYYNSAVKRIADFKAQISMFEEQKWPTQ